MSVYLVATELTRQGWIVSPTSRSAAGADILMTSHDCNRPYSVQVKTNTTGSRRFHFGSNAKTLVSDSHIYILVDIKPGSDPERILFYVVPSRLLSKLATPANPKISAGGYVVHRDAIKTYESDRDQLGDPGL